MPLNMAQAWIKSEKSVFYVIFPSITWEKERNTTVSATQTHLAASLAFYPFERHSRKRVKSAKSLWGEEELLSQFVSSPIHVFLCSLSSFSPLQSVSNKLFSLFLSLHWLLRCLFLYSSEHHSLLLVWAISTGLLCAVHVYLFSGSSGPRGRYAQRKMALYSAHLSLPRRGRSLPVENPHPRALGEEG